MEKEKIILQFKGIDDWNRPIFKRQDTGSFYGDAFNLFSYSATAEDVLTWYKQNPNKLCNIEYFGKRFGCEPEGGSLPDDTIIRITM